MDVFLKLFLPSGQEQIKDSMHYVNTFLIKPIIVDFGIYLSYKKLLTSHVDLRKSNVFGAHRNKRRCMHLISSTAVILLPGIKCMRLGIIIHRTAIMPESKGA